MGMAKYNTDNIMKINPKWLAKKSESALRAQVIAQKKDALVKALKIPPAINQFNTHLSTEEFEKTLTLFKTYAPETRKERKLRLYNIKQGTAKKEKKIIAKKGLNHVTKLIESKKVGLVLIAADVDPIELILFVPSLCVKMGISYGIVESQELVGKLVGAKKASVAALEKVDSKIFKDVLEIVDG